VVSGEASLERQAEFFRIISNYVRNPQVGPSLRFAVVANTAFDSWFKSGPAFIEGDAFTGVLDSTGVPRPAVREILRLCR
jgi:hypothetical protein